MTSRSTTTDSVGDFDGRLIERRDREQQNDNTRPPCLKQAERGSGIACGMRGRWTRRGGRKVRNVGHGHRASKVHAGRAPRRLRRQDRVKATDRLSAGIS